MLATTQFATAAFLWSMPVGWILMAVVGFSLVAGLFIFTAPRLGGGNPQGDDEHTREDDRRAAEERRREDLVAEKHRQGSP